ncbi:MAG TPA: metalloregulator ArsR/SmtB family transcription factor [Symbiobacteriaceae bacterium]|nr:metalloregulator ArsR/SmtB family transcription factor [Symbiobacteriaceae bacterium]
MISLDKVALALSDPIRLQILDMLAVGRDQACCSPENPDAPVALCSCDILPALDLAPSRLSYHMKELRDAGLVTEQKRGRWVYFSLNRSAISDFSGLVHDRFLAPRGQPRAACCSTPLIQVDTTSVDSKEE